MVGELYPLRVVKWLVSRLSELRIAFGYSSGIAGVFLEDMTDGSAESWICCIYLFILNDFHSTSFICSRTDRYYRKQSFGAYSFQLHLPCWQISPSKI